MKNVPSSEALLDEILEFMQSNGIKTNGDSSAIDAGSGNLQNIVETSGSEIIDFSTRSRSMRVSKDLMALLLEATNGDNDGILYDAKHLKRILFQYVLPLQQKDPEQVQKWMDKYLSKPVLAFLIDIGQSNEGRKVKGSMVVPVGVFPLLGVSITRNQELQDIVNAYSIQRRVIRVILVELYCQCIIIVLYMLVCNEYLEDVRDYQGGEIAEEDIGAAGEKSLNLWIGLYFMIGLSFCRHILSITSVGLGQWLLTGFNTLSLTEFVLLIISASWMGAGGHIYQSSDGTPVNVLKEVRLLIVVTSGINVVNFILMLRNTFLPFAMFVNGTKNIIVVLVPFLIVVLLLLFAFMFMYYVQRYDEGLVCDWNRTSDVCYCDASEGGNFCSYKDSFLQVFGYVVDGAPETVDLLDIFCGIVLAVIFLNVVIAIVETAWDEASTDRIHQVFWQYRLEFFSEIRLYSRSVGISHKRIDLIDSLGEGPGLLEEYWLATCREPYTFSDRVENMVRLVRRIALKWLICFPLGLVTFGYFWPEDVRDYMFSNRHDIKVRHDEETISLRIELAKVQTALELETKRAGALEAERNRYIAKVAVLEERARRSEQLLREEPDVFDV